MKVVFASKNEGKIREVKSILKGFEILSISDLGLNLEIIEDGYTYWQNAYKKAKTVYELTGIPVIADDSGLEVEYLGGDPGVNSARYGGFYGNFEKKIELLLLSLDRVPFEKRRARFVCVAVYFNGQVKVFSEGLIEGYIAERACGTAGFGFDPVFFVPELSLTMAQLSLETKNKISHRGKAFRKLKEKIELVYSC